MVSTKLASGALVVLLGAAVASAQTRIHTFYGPAGGFFGSAVNGAGDVNADGHADVIVGSYLESPNGQREAGAARVLSGRDGKTLHTFLGQVPTDHFGRAVGAAGDVDGDGFGDVIVGVPNNDISGSESGAAIVFSGRTGTVLLGLRGAAAGDSFGWAVGSAGDVNADGHDDVVVGAIYNDAGGRDAGSATVFSGRNGAVLHTLRGRSAGDIFGVDVCGAGDVNRDGYDDVLVGAQLDDTVNPDAGSVTLFSGRTGQVLHYKSGPVSSWFGTAVAAPGDVDGDGWRDFAAGARLATPNGPRSGRVFVYSGRTGALLRTFDGETPHELFGYTLGGGDVNGDGYGDLLVGAPWYTSGGLRERGKVVAFCGRTGNQLRRILGDSAGDWLGYAVCIAGDVNRDGYGNALAGAPFGKNNNVTLGSAFVYDLGFRGPPVHVRLYGAACRGSNGNRPHIHHRGRAAVGQTLDLLLRAARPSTVAAIGFGAPRVVDLSALGASGCSTYTLPLGLFAVRTSTAGMARFAVPIPSSPALRGARLGSSWVVLDPGSNRLGVSASNGAEVRIGG